MKILPIIFVLITLNSFSQKVSHDQFSSNGKQFNYKFISNAKVDGLANFYVFINEYDIKEKIIFQNAKTCIKPGSDFYLLTISDDEENKDRLLFDFLNYLQGRRYLADSELYVIISSDFSDYYKKNYLDRSQTKGKGLHSIHRLIILETFNNLCDTLKAQ